MGINSFVAGVVTGLTAAAIGQELAKEPTERTWNGTIAGVPYNFHLATWSEIVGEYWNPESDAILTPHVIGLGWGINFAALTRLAQRLTDSAQSGGQVNGQPTQRLPQRAER